MEKDWYLPPPPATLAEVYFQRPGNNQRSRVRTRRRWLPVKPPVTDWAGLLPDILSLIFHKLTSFEILWPAQAVCRSWRQVALEPRVWRRIDMRNHPKSLYYYSDLEKFAKEAVDRSGGHVEEFYCGDCASDQIFSFIANRTTGLRCLSLWWRCHFFLAEEVLVELVGRCPLLEELHISYKESPPKIFQDIALSCPALQRIRLVNRFYLFWDQFALQKSKPDSNIDEPDIIYSNLRCDGNVLEITNNMPQLRELQLINSSIANEGLHAILDKCPHLDLLDIRLCRNIRLNAKMKARMENINIVRLPRHPIKEYEFCATDMKDFSFLEDNYSNTGCSDDEYMYDDYIDDYSAYDEYDFYVL